MVLVFEHTLHTSSCKSQSTDVVTWALAVSDLPIMATIKIVAQKVKWKWSFLMARRWGIDGVFANICIRRSGEPPVIHRDERSNFLDHGPETPVVEIAWWFRSTTSRATHHEAPSLVPLVNYYNHSPYVGVEEPDAFQLKVFPNPVQDRLSFESNQHVTRVLLRNSAGQVLEDWQGIGSTFHSFDVSHLSHGMYLVEFVSRRRHRLFQRIVVQ